MRNDHEEIINKIYLRAKKLPLSYHGSKKKIFKWIAPLLIDEVGESKTVLDAFSGTGILSALLSLNNNKVYSNDILYSAYSLTATLCQNPGEIIENEELQYLSSHRCVDGVLIDNKNIINIENTIHDKYPGILTTNESLWIKYLNKKLENFSLYKKLIANCAIRGISTIIPFSTSNGTKKFQHRIMQKDNYGNRCLGFYYNTSYEIEYVKWFQQYVNAFNETVLDFSSCRSFDAVAYNDDIFDLLNKNTVDFDVAYFDPPYGKKYKIGHEQIHSFQEDLLDNKIKGHSFFNNPENHRENFNKILEICENIPKIIFSYDNQSWASIDEICLLCERFGRKIRVLSQEHCHGKIQMVSHKNTIIENLIIAEKGK